VFSRIRRRVHEKVQQPNSALWLMVLWRKSREGVCSLLGPLRNIFLFNASHSLLFHVDILTFNAYLGYEIHRCESISLKSWNFRPDAKIKHRSTEIIWKKRKHPSQSGKKGSWMAHKPRFWSLAHMRCSCIIRLPCKWASVSRFLYFDLMYTMHENVTANTYVDANWTSAVVASFC